MGHLTKKGYYFIGMFSSISFIYQLISQFLEMKTT